MNSFLLLIPFLLIRYGLLILLNKKSVKRAAYFPPRVGAEKFAHWIYQISTTAIFLCMLVLSVKIVPTELFYAGLAVYAIGLALCILSVSNFAKPAQNGINLNGLYQFSRNPMYVSYFVFFIGCVLLTQSLLLLGLVLVYQIATHWLILSEERWCVQEFGDEYLQYMKKVRRYL